MSTLEPARLIPVAGINGPAEAEQRAVSALLAVMGVVRPFGRAGRVVGCRDAHILIAVAGELP